MKYTLIIAVLFCGFILVGCSTTPPTEITPSNNEKATIPNQDDEVIDENSARMIELLRKTVE